MAFSHCMVVMVEVAGCFSAAVGEVEYADAGAVVYDEGVVLFLWDEVVVDRHRDQCVAVSHLVEQGPHRHFLFPLELVSVVDRDHAVFLLI